MGKNVRHEKMQYCYSKEMFGGRGRLVWIIGDPDKWISAVFCN